VGGFKKGAGGVGKEVDEDKDADGRGREGELAFGPSSGVERVLSGGEEKILAVFTSLGPGDAAKSAVGVVFEGLRDD
jgi:hypothetical protein